MTMITFKLSETLPAFASLLRRLAPPSSIARPGGKEHHVNLDELPAHMLRDIGILDGHATPARHTARRSSGPFS